MLQVLDIAITTKETKYRYKFSVLISQHSLQGSERKTLEVKAGGDAPAYP